MVEDNEALLCVKPLAQLPIICQRKLPIMDQVQARSQGGSVGSDEPPSQIKGPLFQRKGPVF